MRRLQFEKVHGLGNDFIVLDLRDGGSLLPERDVQILCERRRGIGADGVLTLGPPSGGGELRLDIQNADGSVPEMCGNGLRCVVDVVRAGAVGGPVRVETKAGLRLGWLEEDGQVRITLGAGRILSTEVDVVPTHGWERGVGVDIGNPHLVLFVHSDTSLTALADRFGPVFERHPEFPERVNVGFARVEAEGIRLVVFERGAGRTEACGTGAAACALAAVRVGRWTRPGDVPIDLPGGRLWIGVPEDASAPLQLRGPTARVYAGTVDVDQLRRD